MSAGVPFHMVLASADDAPAIFRPPVGPSFGDFSFDLPKTGAHLTGGAALLAVIQWKSMTTGAWGTLLGEAMDVTDESCICRWAATGVSDVKLADVLGLGPDLKRAVAQRLARGVRDANEQNTLGCDPMTYISVTENDDCVDSCPGYEKTSKVRLSIDAHARGSRGVVPFTIVVEFTLCYGLRQKKNRPTSGEQPLEGHLPDGRFVGPRREIFSEMGGSAEGQGIAMMDQGRARQVSQAERLDPAALRSMEGGANPRRWGVPYSETCCERCTSSGAGCGP